MGKDPNIPTSIDDLKLLIGKAHELSVKSQGDTRAYFHGLSVSYQTFFPAMVELERLRDLHALSLGDNSPLVRRGLKHWTQYHPRLGWSRDFPDAPGTGVSVRVRQANNPKLGYVYDFDFTNDEGASIARGKNLPDVFVAITEAETAVQEWLKAQNP